MAAVTGMLTKGMTELSKPVSDLQLQFRCANASASFAFRGNKWINDDTLGAGAKFFDF